MSEPQILVVTSAGASSAAVVPVLAALEAAGMRVRAIDVGAAGGGGTGVADRVRRAVFGESAERKLKKELETHRADAAVVFDPHAAVALTVARDQVSEPVPVVGVCADLEPSSAWGETDCDRVLAIDGEAAVGLSAAGVEGDRVLVVGPVGPRVFAEAGAEDRLALRRRFGLSGRVVTVEVAGLGVEVTQQLAVQLALVGNASDATYLFDAAGDPDAAAVLRRQVPAVGLRAKLFGATSDAPLLWRTSEVAIGRPRPETVAKVMLIGARLVALGGGGDEDRVGAALEARRRGILARSPLLVSSALDTLAVGAAPLPAVDGADNVADVVWAVAAERRAVIEERRAQARAATQERVRSATQAASAAARSAAMPGALEDLGGAASFVAPPDAAEVNRLRDEVKKRVAELTPLMTAARRAADESAEAAKRARAGGDLGAAAAAEATSERERTHMHALLAELATLEQELAELESLAARAPSSSRPPPASAPPSEAPRRPSVDDMLADLKRQQGTGGAAAPPGPRSGGPRRAADRGADKNVDDELAALKRKMGDPKKKP